MKKNIRTFVTSLFLLILCVGVGLAQQKPTTAEGWFKLGNGNAENRQSAEAIANYTKAIELNPNFGEAYYGRAEVYRRQIKDLHSALKDYVKAFERDPTSAHEFAPVFQKYFTKNKIGAIAEITVLIKNEQVEDPFLYFIRAFFRSGTAPGVKSTKEDLDKSLPDFNKVIELAPKYTIAYAMRATSFEDLNETSKSIADWTKAIELDPTEAEYYRRRAIQYRILAEADEKRAADMGKK